MPTLQWNESWQRDVSERGRDESLGAFRDRFITPFVDPAKTALEIGPGGGRWTRYLLEFERLVCVDLDPDVFHGLLTRFGPRANVSFCRTNGTDLPGVRRGSIDFVLTFGVFVHLDPSILDGYLHSLRSVVAPDADLILQYADKHKPAGAADSTFAPTTGPIMNYLLATAGFEVVDEDRELLPHSNVVHARPV